MIAWKKAYEDSITQVYVSVVDSLPAKVGVVLDVGSGLGGINIPLCADHPGLLVCTLDGLDNPPEVASHHQPFNNAALTQDFLRSNGVKNHKHYPAGAQKFDEKFDLVWSFAAWGFHIYPGDYLDQVKEALAPKAVVVLDVRKTKDHWLAMFIHAFGKNLQVLERGKKHVRVVWQT
jgi:SAM-dependent methyltransferase